MGALELVSRWPVDAAAAGVLRRRGSAAGAAVVAGDPPGGDRAGGVAMVDGIGDMERPYAWASMTKLLVAMAVFVAVEEGTISLDEPAGPPGSTVRHLLAHASGLGPDSPVPVAGLVRMRIYSNIGYEELADTLAQRARMPFSDYLAGGVLTPLRMSGTSLAPGSSPASGARGPLRDLLVLATELLAPSIVSATTLAEATSVAFPGLRGVLPGYGRFDPCDWGLGFEVKGAKTPHWTGTRTTATTFGHFGRAGGFLWVDPATGLACAALSNRDFGPWAVTEWSTLADAVVDQWTAAPVEEASPPSPGSEQPAAPAPLGRRQRKAARAEAAEIDRRHKRAAEAERHERQVAEAAAEAERREQEAANVERRRREAVEAAAADAERRRREAAERAEAERRREKAEAAQAEAERREREATERAESERRKREAAERAEAERRRREAQLAAVAEAERRRREKAEAARAEAERRERQAAERAEAERRRREAAETAAAEAERRRREHAEAAERAEAERLEREAAERAEAERLEREAAERAEAERLEREAAERAEIERLKREAAELAEIWRRDREDVRARTEAARMAAQAFAAESEGPDREHHEAGRRIPAMAERRQEAVARVPDHPPAEPGPGPEPESSDEEHGPLGPGIRPVDFWGVCTP